MDEFSTTSDNLDQTDEEVLTYTVSDEALEAADFKGSPRRDRLRSSILRHQCRSRHLASEQV